jgi:multiple sugar transport system ATP-binding protein
MTDAPPRVYPALTEKREGRTVSGIVLDGVTKVYPGGVRAVDDVSLEIESGEFMVLVGPSGCGKSTLLRMIAGLEEVTEGAILIGDRDVTDLAPRHRDIAMVFQNYALYPHMTVRKNLGYGLKVRKMPTAEIDRRVNDVARLLGLGDFLERRPAALSGGQRQRVAMGRAIVREPAAYLMDEPLSNLDAKLRVAMRAELARLHERLATTTVYVTHDQIEAMTLGQRVTVMRNGLIQQVGAPQELYRDPANLFVAAFIGSPSMNLVDALVEGDRVEFAGFRLPLATDRRPVRDGRVILGIRPDDFEDVAHADPGLPTIDVEVAVLEELGSEDHVIFAVDAKRVEAEELREAHDDEDAQLLAEDGSLFTARVDPRTSARTGRTLTLAVNPAGFHFFDPETGQTLRAREGELAATA